MNTTLPLYVARLADSVEDIRSAQSLRYQVFNLELNEGLECSHEARLDQDEFDEVCDHLVVEHVPTGTIVGNYRLQSGAIAQSRRGFYSNIEFDLQPLAPVLDHSVELGRACVHKAHRNVAVLTLLWKGIVLYAQTHAARFLFGCSSLTSQQPAVGASIYADLCRNHMTPTALRVHPRPAFECPLDQLCEDCPPVPKLLRSYLSIGAKICGPPALDPEFKTIDFLTWLDLEVLPETVRERFARTTVPTIFRNDL